MNDAKTISTMETQATPQEDTRITIAEFDKNRREKVRVSLTTYRGQELLDVRAFYSDGDEWKPGKGLTVRRELVTALREALQAAEAAVQRGGGG